ncbi:MAG: ABC transporter permease [Actinomycetota bacterium]|nr:ABC transporter permease [Actinomycetota bacterium]
MVVGVVLVVLPALLRAVLLLAATSLVVFGATSALPGDAVELRIGGRAGEGEIERLRAEVGLDRSFPERYVTWMSDVAQGRPGISLVSGRPVSELVGQRLPVSLTLTAAAMLVALPTLLALAWVAVRGPARARAVATTVTVAGAATPLPVVAIILTALLAGDAGLVPPVSMLRVGVPPWQQPELLVLPALSLALPSAAYGAGLLQGAWADATMTPTVLDAELRGLPRRRVACRYLAPRLAPVVVRIIAMLTGGVLAGTAVVETLFGLSGLGDLLISSVRARDLPVVQAVAMLTAAIVVSGFLVADLLAARTGRALAAPR